MACEGRTRNAEQFCCTTLILMCLLEDEPDMSFQGTCEREIDARITVVVIAGQHGNRFARFRRSSIWLQIGRKNDVFGQNHRPITEQRHRAHRVAQFTKISPPLMVKQFLHRFRMNCCDIFAFFQSSRFQFRSDQRRQLLQPLPQRRNKQREAIQSLVKVFPEFSVPHPFAQRTV